MMQAQAPAKKDESKEMSLCLHCRASGAKSEEREGDSCERARDSSGLELEVRPVLLADEEEGETDGWQRRQGVVGTARGMEG